MLGCHIKEWQEIGNTQNKELRVKKAVEDNDEEQEDEGQWPSYDVWRKKLQSKRVHLVNYWTGIQHPGTKEVLKRSVKRVSHKILGIAQILHHFHCFHRIIKR